MANSISLDAYVRSVKRLWPSATVWTKGDEAHRGSPSDHNNDDMAGSKPEQVDADSKAEIRAADIPKLGGVTMAMLDTLRARLTDRPANRARAKYVILRQTIWRRNGGWVPEVYRGAYHDHLHMSHHVDDDNNGADWDIGDDAPPPVTVSGAVGAAGAEETTMFFFCGVEQGNPDGHRWAFVSGGAWFEYDQQTVGTHIAGALRGVEGGKPLSATKCTLEAWQGLKAPFEAAHRVFSGQPLNPEGSARS